MQPLTIGSSLFGPGILSVRKNTQNDGVSIVIVARVVTGVTGHFLLRFPDWIMAVMLWNWGWILVQPEYSFDGKPSFATMALLADAQTWGVCIMIVATIRLFALGINGTFRQFRWSPHLRACGSMLSCFVWFCIAAGLYSSGVYSTGWAVYKYLVLIDMVNVFVASAEAGKVERARVHGHNS